MDFGEECETTELKVLSESELQKLDAQDSRIMSDWNKDRLESESRKHWDLFYKRNENRFFKDRHWTTREFKELAELPEGEERKKLVELGCGTGNLLYPLIEEGLPLEIWAVDLSPRALEMVKKHPCYDPNIIHPVEGNVLCPDNLVNIPPVDIVTAVFVLSAINPLKSKLALENIFNILKPGGLLLLRDYARYDMAQLRFAPGRKISDNFYARQDGTRAYFFTIEEIDNLCTSVGFNQISNVYALRRTINKKEGINVQRIFIQAKYSKPTLNQLN